MDKYLLEVKNLKTSFWREDKSEIKALRGVSFAIKPGEIVGIVGESGCGKSVTMRSVMGLLPSNGKVTAGEILFNGQQLLTLSESQMNKIRGNNISMIFQDPMTSLNPLLSIGYQIKEQIKLHRKAASKELLHDEIIALLRRVGIPEPEMRLKQYPYEFSGGMIQRIMIAMAMSNNPQLLIADEPTTALDVTVQDQILQLMKDIAEKHGSSIILITHDLGVIAQVCKKVLVMYAGEIVEQGEIHEIFKKPSHPYTQALLRSLPSYQRDEEKLYSIAGFPPSLDRELPGCGFASRCQFGVNLCARCCPEMYSVSETHAVKCHNYASSVSGKLFSLSEEAVV
ncbi:MAG: ABC transporter ATP-binding protein [Eubacteriales bacterium]|nr:ABC transporter ATP-binding protein [Eubacteriales bacterium]